MSFLWLKHVLEVNCVTPWFLKWHVLRFLFRKYFKEFMILLWYSLFRSFFFWFFLLHFKHTYCFVNLVLNVVFLFFEREDECQLQLKHVAVLRTLCHSYHSLGPINVWIVCFSQENSRLNVFFSRSITSTMIFSQCLWNLTISSTEWMILPVEFHVPSTSYTGIGFHMGIMAPCAFQPMFCQ